MQQPVSNPALRLLDLLVGEWDTEAVLPGDPHAAIRGYASFQWFDGGGFLVMRSGVPQTDFPRAEAIIGSDDSVGTYSMLYFDSRGLSRIYAMSLSNRAWKIWREAPGFSQRFTGTFSDNGATITARWEKSSDGATWEHDFDLTYRKVGLPPSSGTSR